MIYSAADQILNRVQIQYGAAGSTTLLTVDAQSSPDGYCEREVEVPIDEFAYSVIQSLLLNISTGFPIESADLLEGISTKPAARVLTIERRFAITAAEYRQIKQSFRSLNFQAFTHSETVETVIPLNFAGGRLLVRQEKLHPDVGDSYKLLLLANRPDEVNGSEQITQESRVDRMVAETIIDIAAFLKGSSIPSLNCSCDWSYGMSDRGAIQVSLDRLPDVGRFAGHYLTISVYDHPELTDATLATVPEEMAEQILNSRRAPIVTTFLQMMESVS